LSERKREKERERERERKREREREREKERERERARELKIRSLSELLETIILEANVFSERRRTTFFCLCFHQIKSWK
jgi:hypothetical protein